MRTKSRAIGPVATGTVSSSTIGLVRRSRNSSTSSSGASSGRRPLVRHIDSRTKRLAVATAEVARLTQHVQQLQQLRDLLREKTMSRAETVAGSIPRTLRTYFEVFRHGYQPQIKTEHAGSEISTDAFLFSVIDEDVVGGGFRGIKTVQGQWKRYTQLFGGPRLRLLHYDIVPLDETGDSDWKVLVSANVSHSGHITLKTIEMLFPHVMADTALVMSLLGRPIAGDWGAQFVFDCNTGRIVECRLNIDMLTTFAEIVEQPSDLAVLFKLAQLTPEYFLGGNDCGAASQTEPSGANDSQDSTLITDPVEPTTLIESPARRRDDPMSMKNILTVDDGDYESDAVEIRGVKGVD